MLARKVKIVAIILKAIGQSSANLDFDVTVNQTQMEKVAHVLKRKVWIANTCLY